ncbi:integrator complex subunit 10-like isoform X2 [Orbicella faveolata]|uniref:integrator complex subunit 10-like isoform X2 n=1 Tax=Orbicella faveolata TaxID=48498 RepID=UPI0009E4183C|nr:integrator complex subunit 10-like isoform X2 [Orbicella faveolata]
MSKHSLEEGTEEEMIEKTGVMFAAIILFLQTVWEYCRVVNRLDLVSSSGLVFPLVLIEDSVNENHQSSASSNSAGGGSNSPAPKKKKRKLASGRPGSPGKDDSKNKQPANIIIDKNCGSVSQNLSDDFTVSVEAWHLLNTHTDYKNDFTRLLDEWEVDQWNWMGTFEVDRLIYKVVPLQPHSLPNIRSPPTLHFSLKVILLVRKTKKTRADIICLSNSIFQAFS